MDRWSRDSTGITGIADKLLGKSRILTATGENAKQILSKLRLPSER